MNIKKEQQILNTCCSYFLYDTESQIIKLEFSTPDQDK